MADEGGRRPPLHRQSKLPLCEGQFSVLADEGFPASQGGAAHYLDTLEGEPHYMVFFSLLWVGDVVFSRKPLIYVFKEFNGFGV
jgi:hypothetical protein